MTDTNAEQPVSAPPLISWDETNMSSSYVNVCNVSSVGDEIIILFGTNQSDLGAATSEDSKPCGDIRVELTDRLVLRPRVARRLLRQLSRALDEIAGRDSRAETESRRAAQADAASVEARGRNDR